jgi:hypothetical protein
MPRVNHSKFVATRKNCIAAIIPDGRLVEVSVALAGAGVDLAEVDVLQGELGAEILDFDGTEHGRWAHVVRTLQKLGTASNERENFANALHDGKLIVLISLHDGADVTGFARILDEHGGRRIIHFGKHAVERFSY